MQLEATRRFEVETKLMKFCAINKLSEI